MTVTEQQVRMMQKEISEHGNLGVAALKAGMSRQTASKYYREGKSPLELKRERTWRTRPNPFEKVWPEIEEILCNSPGLDAANIFDELSERYPDQFFPGQLRTLQRQVRKWRALKGNDESYELFFTQRHRPGEAAQTDFTHIGELGITIDGQPFKALLCHVVLPYSNWEWASLCQSESFFALRHGIQEAFFRLGKVPEWHQTDNSTSATHNISSGGRDFLKDYQELMDHLGMKPRTIGIGKKEQNGTVEAKNGALKRFLKQKLLRRGSHDFESGKAFESFLHICLQRLNSKRSLRLIEELNVMKPLLVQKFPEFSEQIIRVSRNSTINVRQNMYSMPPRFIGHQVKVRIYESHIDVFYGEEKIQSMPKLLGVSNHQINYRHVIWSLIRKPGAFERYIYREDLYPTMVFKKAYEVLKNASPGLKGDIAYLRILHLAASTMESDVECALQLILEDGKVPDPETVRALIASERLKIPELKELDPDLNDYNSLLKEVAS